MSLTPAFFWIFSFYMVSCVICLYQCTRKVRDVQTVA